MTSKNHLPQYYTKANGSSEAIKYLAEFAKYSGVPDIWEMRYNIASFLLGTATLILLVGLTVDAIFYSEGYVMGFSYVAMLITISIATVVMAIVFACMLFNIILQVAMHFSIKKGALEVYELDLTREGVILSSSLGHKVKLPLDGDDAFMASRIVLNLLTGNWAVYESIDSYINSGDEEVFLENVKAGLKT